MKLPKLSANTLKVIAIIAMTIDHVAFVFVDSTTPLWVVMRIIGRLTAPVMAFGIAEGFHYTKNRNKYLLRMAIFAIIAQIPYSLMVGSLRLNVMYTFAVSILMLMILSGHWRINVYLQTLLFAVCLCLSTIGDWGYILPLFVLAFYRFRGNYKLQAVSFVIVAVLSSFQFGVLQFGTLLALIPLYVYSGERGGGNKAVSKWFFYGYYAVHMTAIIAVKFILEGAL